MRLYPRQRLLRRCRPVSAAPERLQGNATVEPCEIECAWRRRTVRRPYKLAEGFPESPQRFPSPCRVVAAALASCCRSLRGADFPWKSSPTEPGGREAEARSGGVPSPPPPTRMIRCGRKCGAAAVAPARSRRAFRSRACVVSPSLNSRASPPLCSERRIRPTSSRQIHEPGKSALLRCGTSAGGPAEPNGAVLACVLAAEIAPAPSSMAIRLGRANHLRTEFGFDILPP